MTFAATVTNTTSDTRSLDVVFKAWTGDGQQVEPLTNGLLMHGAARTWRSSASRPASGRSAADKGALDANLRGAGLNGDQGGNYRRAGISARDPGRGRERHPHRRGRGGLR